MSKLDQWAAIPREHVPYVAAWSDEKAIAIKPCVYARGPAICRPQRIGSGSPLLGKMDEFRQRRCMVVKLCQVCGEPPGMFSIGLDRVASVNLPGQILRLPVLFEPPACVRCAKLALVRCPALGRLREAGKLAVYKVRAYQLMLSHVGPDGSGDALDRALAKWKGSAPVGYARAVLRDFDTITAEDVEAMEPPPLVADEPTSLLVGSPEFKKLCQSRLNAILQSGPKGKR